MTYWSEWCVNSSRNSKDPETTAFPPWVMIQDDKRFFFSLLLYSRKSRYFIRSGEISWMWPAVELMYFILDKSKWVVVTSSFRLICKVAEVKAIFCARNHNDVNNLMILSLEISPSSVYISREKNISSIWELRRSSHFNHQAKFWRQIHIKES
jgi:hypothetical protein